MSDSEVAQETGQSFRIGEIFSLSFSILSKHLVVFIGLSALFYVPMLILMAIGLTRMSQGDAGGGLAITALSGIVNMIFGLVLVAAVTYGTFRSLQGREVTLGGALQQGLGRFLPVLGVSLVAGIAIGLGFLLLVIPGLIIAMILYVAVPAVVVERTGIFESLSRSSDLTKGYRWQIFGIVALLWLLSMACNFLVGLIAPAQTFSSFGAEAAMPQFSLLNFILSGVVGIVFYALGAIFPAVIYYKLRMVKEGMDVDQVAAVFD